MVEGEGGQREQLVRGPQHEKCSSTVEYGYLHQTDLSIKISWKDSILAIGTKVLQIALDRFFA